MTRHFYKILSIATAIFFSGNISAQELISYGLTKDTILIGDQIEWKVKMKVPRDLTIEVDSLGNPVTPGVERLGHFLIDTLTLKKKYAQVEAKATLTSFDSGSYVIPPRVFYFYRGNDLVDTIRIKDLALEVTTIPIDTATYKMYDIKPQFGYPVTFKEILPWVGGMILLIAIIFFMAWMLKNRKAHKTLFGKPIVKDPPHIVALRNLDKIRNEKLWQNKKQKQFYTEITDTLRIYLEGRYHIKTMERTSNEILSDLSLQKVETSQMEEITDLFSRADLVKFAKYSATDDENESTIPAAVRFVNATFLQEIEEDKKDGK